MINLEHAIIARYRKSGKTFEILVDCDKALELKEILKKQDVEFQQVEDVIASADIFADALRGLRISEADLKMVFGTIDHVIILKQIIKEGEIQVTAEHKKKLREEKKKSIMRIISELGVDPRTGHVHPVSRIENAFEEAKVHVDEHKSAEDQVQEIVKKLRPILPISFEKKQIDVRIPAMYTGKAYPAVKKYGVSKEEWLNDGTLLVRLEMSASAFNDFVASISKLTQGYAEIKDLNAKK